MSLPKLTIPTYSVKLYSQKTPIKFRPYTVKEEKVILMALESNDKVEMFETMVQLCESCVINDIDIYDLPLFDLEKLVVAIRSKSVGEEVTFMNKCDHCDSRTEVSLNIQNMKNKDESGIINKIMLTEDCGVTLKYPSLKSVNLHTEKQNEELDDIYKSCIETVFDKETVYTFDDQSKDEQENFINSMTLEMINEINEKFLSKIPTNYLELKYKCPACGENTEKRFDNIISFFI